MMRPRRRWVVVAALCVLLGASAAAWRSAWLLDVGLAYKAKSVCSGVFVSGRPFDSVVAEAELDDLNFLKYVRVTSDASSRTVTASVVGLFPRRAVYRDGLGCALLLDDFVPPAAPPAIASVSGLSSPPHRVPPAGLAQPTRAAAFRISALAPLRDRLAKVVDGAFAEPDDAQRRRTQALLILHDGAVVAERYADGIGADTPLIGWSMTKTALNALVGVLVREGRIDVHAPVALPEWSPDDPRSAISMDHLLRMSSGLAFVEDPAHPRSDVVRMLYASGDAAAVAVHQTLLALPGTRWAYSSGTSNIIARVIRHVLRDQSEYLRFPARALFQPLGLERAVLETDAAGTFLGSSHMYATAREWARLGLLFMADGMWERERILPPGWVDYSTTPAPADASRRYGAHLWLRVPREYCASGDDLPDDLYHAVGHEAQFVTISPAARLVVVRLGRTRYAAAWDHCAFMRRVLAALHPDGT